MFNPQQFDTRQFDHGTPAMHSLPHPPPLTPGEDNCALDDLTTLFGPEADAVSLPPPEQITHPGIDDVSGPWSGSKQCLLPTPSPFESMPDPSVLQELSAEATCGNFRGLSLPHGELQPARNSDLTLSTGRKVAKCKRGSSKVSKGFRRLSSEGSGVAGRTAAKLLWCSQSRNLVPAATAPVGNFPSPSQHSPDMQHGSNLANENAQLWQRLDAAMMEVELLRDVVGRLLEMRGPTRVPNGAARMAANNHAASYHQQVYQNVVYQDQHCSTHPGTSQYAM